MAGSSIRRSKRLRRNAPNGGGGGLALIGAVVWYSRFLCFGAGMVFRFVYSFRWLGVGCPTGGVGYRGWVCVVHVLGDTDEVIQTNMLDNPPSDNLESPPAVLPTTIQPDPVQDDSDSGLGGEDVPEHQMRHYIADKNRYMRFSLMHHRRCNGDEHGLHGRSECIGLSPLRPLP
nr:hypothetical protein Iba_chr10fCG7040 [Ipomoea batatas]